MSGAFGPTGIAGLGFDPAAEIQAKIADIMAGFDPLKAAVTGSVATFNKLAEAGGFLYVYFNKIADVLSGFVEALSPGTIIIFNQALKNLNATLGEGFQPFFLILTGMIRQVSGIILPVMEALRPVVEATTSYIAAALLPIIRLLANYFQLLFSALQNSPLQLVFAPLFILAEVLKGLSDIITPIISAFRILFESFNIHFSLKDIFAFLVTAIQLMVSQIVRAMGLMLSAVDEYFGGNRLGKFIEGFDTSKQGLTAAGPASIKGFEQIAKDLALASSQAAGGGAGKTERDYLQEAVEYLKQIAAHGGGLSPPALPAGAGGVLHGIARTELAIVTLGLSESRVGRFIFGTLGGL
jgi:hypothetical protein